MPAPPSEPSEPVGGRARLGVGAVAVVVALLAAPIATHTWQSTAVTGAIGVVALAATIAGRPARTGVPRRLGRTAVPWFVVFALVTVVELGALAWGDRASFPTVSWLLGPYFIEPAVRFAGYVAWICAGFWLVRR
ncbi:hypothetical protein [Pseudonocardia sediminis]|uniref:hypothetical protein n=1 Tax=Pseudonocardia sediminis TaxID=1397368 RepID=UPI00102A81FF|nr:hypothetical protein [Pseudonocardia sediminis]